MSEDAWEKFLSYSKQILGRPRFDEGDRDWKFEVAAEVRRLLGNAGDAEQWVSDLSAAFPVPLDMRDHRLHLPSARHVGWLKKWARADLGSLQRALSAFEDPGRDPVERFGAFAHEAEAAPPEVGAFGGGIIATGSFFNFSLEPESLPIMRRPPFDRVQEALGCGLERVLPVTERYAQYLAFARQAKERMEQLGVRDMVDVQSLIFIAGFEHEYWATEEPEEVRRERERAAVAREGKPYLSACAMYRDEAPYLQEWIEFHLLVGVERFFLYNNRSGDNHLEVLAPYIEDGTVVLYDWPVSPGQMQANDHCVKEHRYDSRWLAILDIDEFLFSPTGLPVPDVLADYEQHPGIAVNWVAFGTAGHRTRPPGLVIENHLLRAREPWRWVKNVVDPARVVRCIQAHAFDYTFRTAVDENHLPLHLDAGRTQFGSVSCLRINHYYLRSEAEGRVKLDTPFEGTPRPFTFEELDRWLSEEHDETILRYAPALREAMAGKASRAYP